MKPLKRKHESGTLGKPRKKIPYRRETLGEETVDEEALERNPERGNCGERKETLEEEALRGNPDH
jgi:hypothetical protein